MCPFLLWPIPIWLREYCVPGLPTQSKISQSQVPGSPTKDRLGDWLRGAQLPLSRQCETWSRTSSVSLVRGRGQRGRRSCMEILGAYLCRTLHMPAAAESRKKLTKYDMPTFDLENNRIMASVHWLTAQWLVSATVPGVYLVGDPDF